MVEKDQKLTEEQRKFVEDNHNLIYSFAKKNGLDLEEYYGILAIGLCKAALSFDPDRGFLFSTYAYKSMQHACYMYWRHEYTAKSAVPSALIFSYNAPLTDDPYSKDIIDKLNNIFGSYDFDPTKAELKEFFSGLQEKEKMVLNDALYGFTQEVTASRFGVTQAEISRIRKRLLKRWKDGTYKSK